MTKHILLALAFCTGCEGLTTPPQPIVSALVRTPDDCFALMTTLVPISSTLEIAGTCSYTAGPMLLAGIDLVELVVDYGPDVDFGDTPAPPPVVSLTVDGAPSDVPIELAPGRVGGRAYFIATFRAPPVRSNDMRISAGVNAGFETTVPDVFLVLDPPVTIALLECPAGTTCELAGGVGSAHALVSVPGDVPQTIAVHTALDGIAQPDVTPPITTAIVGDHTEATVEIRVPAASDGAMWTVLAQLGAQAPAATSARIDAPLIGSQLTCGDTCTLARGAAVGLEITAPAHIIGLQALVDTRLDGVPQLVAAPVTLVDNADGTATGLIALHAPASAGSWEIDASVAGYSAPAIIATVQ